MCRLVAAHDAPRRGPLVGADRYRGHTAGREEDENAELLQRIYAQHASMRTVRSKGMWQDESVERYRCEVVAAPQELELFRPLSVLLASAMCYSEVLLTIAEQYDSKPVRKRRARPLHVWFMEAVPVCRGNTIIRSIVEACEECSLLLIYLPMRRCMGMRLSERRACARVDAGRDGPGLSDQELHARYLEVGIHLPAHSMEHDARPPRCALNPFICR